MVKIEEQHRDTALPPDACSKREVQAIRQKRPVWQTRKRIAGCHFADILFLAGMVGKIAMMRIMPVTVPSRRSGVAENSYTPSRCGRPLVQTLARSASSSSAAGRSKPAQTRQRGCPSPVGRPPMKLIHGTSRTPHGSCGEQPPSYRARKAPR